MRIHLEPVEKLFTEKLHPRDPLGRWVNGAGVTSSGRSIPYMSDRYGGDTLYGAAEMMRRGHLDQAADNIVQGGIDAQDAGVPHEPAMRMAHRVRALANRANPKRAAIDRPAPSEIHAVADIVDRVGDQLKHHKGWQNSKHPKQPRGQTGPVGDAGAAAGPGIAIPDMPTILNSLRP